MRFAEANPFFFSCCIRLEFRLSLGQLRLRLGQLGFTCTAFDNANQVTGFHLVALGNQALFKNTGCLCAYRDNRIGLGASANQYGFVRVSAISGT